jgi:hypothetical protein
MTVPVFCDPEGDKDRVMVSFKVLFVVALTAPAVFPRNNDPGMLFAVGP